MKTELILVGKTTDKHLQAGIEDYVGRIGHYMPFALTVIPELKNTKSLSEDQQNSEKKRVQNLTDKYVKLVDERLKEKTDEVMSI